MTVRSLKTPRSSINSETVGNRLQYTWMPSIYKSIVLFYILELSLIPCTVWPGENWLISLMFFSSLLAYWEFYSLPMIITEYIFSKMYQFSCVWYQMQYLNNSTEFSWMCQCIFFKAALLYIWTWRLTGVKMKNRL